ncbi:MAG: hypothetical protein II711_01565 [Clostridia bacterium]|nr:hypothetical protein [Clostridia bacterium]
MGSSHDYEYNRSSFWEGVKFMLPAIISALVCLAAATLLYTPRLRNFQHYRPIALFFLFEGVWVLIDYLMKQISPDNVFMELIHYIGLIILGLYFMVSVLFLSKKKRPAEEKRSTNHKR